MALFTRFQASAYNPGNINANTLHRNLMAATTDCDVEKLAQVATTWKMWTRHETVDAPYPFDALAASGAQRGDVLLSGKDGYVVVRDMTARVLTLKALSAKRVAAIQRVCK